MKVPLIAFALLVGVILCSCESQEQKEERIAKQYCGSCHIFPNPQLLPKNTWEKSVLPEMAFRMGISMEKMNTYSYEDLKEIMKVIPTKPMMSDKEWALIKSYYSKNAPDTLLPGTKATRAPLKQFSVEKFSHSGLPFITLIKADTANNRIFYGTRFAQLYELTNSFQLRDSFMLKSPASNLAIESADRVVLSQMGIMDPNDQARGNMALLNLSDHNNLSFIDSIKRPVHFEIADLNGDGRKDYIVCAFGNFSGMLTAYESSGNDQYKPHIVSALPGTRKVVVRDFNNDGKDDILALISQGNEQITLFVNKGNFEFEASTLLRFPPVYGSSYFDVADFNKDGTFDILYTNGDNSDYSAILKPYHGIRIFINDGKQHFSESWFYPMNGASEAVALDFDKDGDMDIAAISFFPDFDNDPQEGFIYFENTGNTFVAQEIPASQWGRWLVIEAADIDHDGDDDLMLGALTFKPRQKHVMQTWMDNKTSILILRNNHIQEKKP